jgi:hypothetical protein
MAGLQYLLTETELPSELERENASDTRVTIPLQQRPDLRATAARLAYNLFLLLMEREQEIPDVIQKWQDVATNDPLPEVRHAWSSA